MSNDVNQSGRALTQGPTPFRVGLRPMRVLYVARAPFVSGAERAMMSMLRHLDRTRIEPHLALGHETELVQQARAMDVPVTMLAVPKRSKATMLTWWRSLWRMTKLVKQFRPDVLHANDVPSCQAMSVVGARLGVPRVVHVRWVINAASAGWWARAGAECLVCISKWVRDELGDPRGTPLERSRVEVVADGVDWPAGEAGAQAIDVGARPATELTLGFTGQLIESKGLELVIIAMGRLPVEKRPRLLVAGEDTQSGGVYLARLKSLAEQCGVADRIEWLGFLKDVTALHRRVDAMVCPSRIEPLGLVPLEAACFAVPAIANRVGGLAETIEDGVTGMLVEPVVDAWAEALGRVERATLRTWGAAARERTKERYSPNVYQARLMSVYENLSLAGAKPQAAEVGTA
jgi:glycosyltransferase involved in cell wall biosynthesis